MSDITGTLLVVDDEPEIREIIELYASDIGMEVIEAKDGQDALELFRERHIDVILSDLQMPRMSGISLLEAIREEGHITPLIFITAYPSRDSTVHALRLGAFDYLEKPFEKRHIQSLIKEAMRVSKEQQQVYKETKIPEDTPETEEARLAIGRMRTLRYQDEPAADNEQKTRQQKLKELFVEEASPQLTFCRAAVEALVDFDNRSWELGYLLRVMRAVHAAAEAIDEPELVEILKAAEKAYTFLRIKPRAVTENVMTVLKEANNAISDMVSRMTVEGEQIQAPKQVVRLLNEIADSINNGNQIQLQAS